MNEIVLRHRLPKDFPLKGFLAFLKEHSEGYREGLARAVIVVLRAHGIAVSDEERERILAEKNLGRLERWLERVALAASLADVLDEPSRMRECTRTETESYRCTRTETESYGCTRTES